LDPLAQDIGAVNIVYQNSDGKLIGSNSDGYGFRRAIGNNRLPKGNASIIGSGGAARAIITELILNGNSEIEIVSRNQQKAEAIARGYQKIYDFKVRVVSTSDFQDTDVLINTIPTATDLSGLKNTALVIDTVYHPLDTDFLKEAQLRGNEIVPGLMMLIYQATIAFEMWFGVKPEVNQELYEYLK
jgi:shikimate dehydrogenase